MASLEALAEVHARHGHLQEVILQNFVPHPRYHGQRGGGDRRPTPRAGAGGERATARGRDRRRAAARMGDPVTVDDMKRLVRRLPRG